MFVHTSKFIKTNSLGVKKCSQTRSFLFDAAILTKVVPQKCTSVRGWGSLCSSNKEGEAWYTLLSACAVSFYHAETPYALNKQQLVTIARNTFRHCRVRL